MEPFRSQVTSIEIDPAEPVHLGVKEPSADKEIRPAKIGPRLPARGIDTGDPLSFNDQVHERRRFRQFSLNDHFSKVFDFTVANLAGKIPLTLPSPARGRG